MAGKRKLPDTQNHKAPIQHSLQKVGIRQFIHDAVVYRGNTEGFASSSLLLPADFSMYVNLGKGVRGISMSRLPRLLLALTKMTTFLPEVLLNWCHYIVKEIPKTSQAYIKAHLKIPKAKQSPVSEMVGTEYYDTTWEIQQNEKGGIRCLLTVIIRYISTCPCSLHLSRHAEKYMKVSRANPHMQPSYAKVKVEVKEDTYVNPHFLFGLIEGIEKTLVTIPYPIVKREDEQAIAIACGKHQMFCEDAARLLARYLNGRYVVEDWVVVCDHDESIHSHFATSVTWRGNPGGLR